MPRFNPFNRATWGVLGRHERRTLGPGYRRMRAGGRATFTVFTKVNPRSRKAIQKTWSSFVGETSAHREVFFRHIFGQLTPQQNRMVARMGVTRDELVERLSHPSNQAYLRRVLGHNKVVEGTKVAADRFFLKNVSSVLLKATKGRRGLAKGILPDFISPGSARDDIATGILAAVEQYGVPKAPGTTPTPVTPVPPVTPGPRGTRTPVVAPTPTRPPRPVRIPVASEPDEDEVGRVPVSEHEDELGHVPPAAETPREGPTAEAYLSELVTRAFAPQRIRVAQLAELGIKHHEPSREALSSDRTLTRDRIRSLTAHSSRYLHHLMAQGVTEEDVEHVVNHSLEAPTVRDLQTRIERVISLSRRAKNASIMRDYHLPVGAKLFDESGREVSKVSLLNIDRIRQGTSATSAQSLTQEQRALVSYHLLATLAKHGSERAAPKHLNLFALKSHNDVLDAASALYEEFHYQPRKLSTEKRLGILAQVLMHGNLSQRDLDRLVAEREAAEEARRAA